MKQLNQIIKSLHFIVCHPLNRHRKGTAIYRWLNWQIKSRLTSGPIAVPFVNHAKLYVSRSNWGATGNVYCGLHEFSEMSFTLHLLRPNDLFVDVGANVGSYTILAAGGIGARCISLEPSPQACRSLIHNVEQNEISQLVQVFNVAAGREDKVIQVTTILDAMNHVILGIEDPSEKRTEVPVFALDTLLKKEAPVLIKIDVEGFETEVINGAQRVLTQDSLLAVVIETIRDNRYGFDLQNLHRKMLTLDYQPFSYDPFKREIFPLGGVNSEGNNTIYVHRRHVETVKLRLKEAPKFTIQGISL